MNSITGNITKNDKKDSRQTKRRKTSLEFRMSKNAIIMYSSLQLTTFIGTNKKISYTVVVRTYEKDH